MGGEDAVKRIFVLDDDAGRIAWFQRRVPCAVIATSCAPALEILSENQFDVVYLDHDLRWIDGGNANLRHHNGQEVARFLAYSRFSGRIIIHSLNPEGRERMAKILPQAEVMPFGTLEISSSGEPR